MLYNVTSFSFRIPHRLAKKEVRTLSRKSISNTGSTFPMISKNSDNSCLLWNKLNYKGRQLSVLNQGELLKNNLDFSGIKQTMDDTFVDIVNDFTKDPKYSDIPEAISCFKNILEYNVPTGKRTRAVALLHCYKRMEDSKNLTSQNIKLANILAWCVEMMQSVCIIVDDILDGAQTRRGTKCWYKTEGVGSRVAVDVVLLENCIYQLLERYFTHLPMYVAATELLQQAFIKTGFGEILDSIPYDVNKTSALDSFTKRHLQTLVKYKTTLSTFELPYDLARCLSNKYHIEVLPETREIFIKLGEFYQIQNDFMDCYDDASTSSKTGNDIEEGKCSWLITEALEKVNLEQRRLLNAHYGRKDPESVNIVKQLYNDLEIPKAYATYEKQTFNFIEENIDHVSKLTCHEIMFKPLNYLYDRYI